MVIVYIAGGLGNQFKQYAAGRYLAYKLNTELKLDARWMVSITKLMKQRFHLYYRLGAFNVLENFATNEEIKYVKEHGVILQNPLPKLEDIKGDVYMQGQWPQPEEHYPEIIDIIRKEFTLKEPFSPKAELYRQKILSAECSVSMHFRHGDFAYNPKAISGDLDKSSWFNITPLDYYYTCIDILKQKYNDITVFGFSDNLLWVKENLRLDVPTEFVEGCATDDEEFILMSLCKHNINCNSTFSSCAADLNVNPDKKVFFAKASTADGVQKFLDSLTPARKEALLSTKGRIGVPFDYYNQPEITQRPIFSLLLVVNDDAATIEQTLDSLLSQDYKYYEIVIIDNASTDGSDKICRQAIEGKANITLKRFEARVSNAVAWNDAFKVAQGHYVSFLKSGDRFLSNSLSSLYLTNEQRQKDIIHFFAWLSEDENGTITFASKKYAEKYDALFKDEKREVINGYNGIDAAKLLLNQQINSFLATKFYRVDFLKDNRIKFDEKLSDKEAELFFQMEAFFKSKYFMYVANAFYVAPKN